MWCGKKKALLLNAAYFATLKQRCASHDAPAKVSCYRGVIRGSVSRNAVHTANGGLNQSCEGFHVPVEIAEVSLHLQRATAVCYKCTLCALLSVCTLIGAHIFEKLLRDEFKLYRSPEQGQHPWGNFPAWSVSQRQLQGAPASPRRSLMCRLRVCVLDGASTRASERAGCETVLGWSSFRLHHRARGFSA